MQPYSALLLALVARVAAQSLAPTAAIIMAPAAPEITTPAVLPKSLTRLVQVADATVQSPHQDAAAATVQSPRKAAGATVQSPAGDAAAAAATVQGPQPMTAVYAEATVQGTAGFAQYATVQGPKQADATVQGTAGFVDATVQGPKPTAACAEATVQGPKQAGATVQKRRTTAFAQIPIKQATITSISQPPPTSRAEMAEATVQGPQVRSLGDGDASVQWPKKRMAIPTAAAGWLWAATSS